ncbi:zinc finger FYVE domain-containing protein 16-like isoform X2 [Xenia sp. Carnegie-2017]|uniref:zinc finger FYVE domain-containing protein 16-like isoform X2 n=1 Tax=Xenia sp. Carnegie-2017 TaxID=2897299 RepID=UPI001F043B60|nr:zinc finger FYVE domain-containing protein 16-like isoform X2 [Xenia sp. Carnegie-2017]
MSDTFVPVDLDKLLDDFEQQDAQSHESLISHTSENTHAPCSNGTITSESSLSLPKTVQCKAFAGPKMLSEDHARNFEVTNVTSLVSNKNIDVQFGNVDADKFSFKNMNEHSKLKAKCSVAELSEAEPSEAKTSIDDLVDLTCETVSSKPAFSKTCYTVSSTPAFSNGIDLLGPMDSVTETLSDVAILIPNRRSSPTNLQHLEARPSNKPSDLQKDISLISIDAPFANGGTTSHPINVLAASDDMQTECKGFDEKYGESLSIKKSQITAPSSASNENSVNNYLKSAAAAAVNVTKPGESSVIDKNSMASTHVATEIKNFDGSKIVDASSSNQNSVDTSFESADANAINVTKPEESSKMDGNSLASIHYTTEMRAGTSKSNKNSTKTSSESAFANVMNVTKPEESSKMDGNSLASIHVTTEMRAGTSKSNKNSVDTSSESAVANVMNVTKPEESSKMDGNSLASIHGTTEMRASTSKSNKNSTKTSSESAVANVMNITKPEESSKMDGNSLASIHGTTEMRAGTSKSNKNSVDTSSESAVANVMNVTKPEESSKMDGNSLASIHGTTEMRAGTSKSNKNSVDTSSESAVANVMNVTKPEESSKRDGNSLASIHVTTEMRASTSKSNKKSVDTSSESAVANVMNVTKPEESSKMDGNSLASIHVTTEMRASTSKSNKNSVDTSSESAVANVIKVIKPDESSKMDRNSLALTRVATEMKAGTSVSNKNSVVTSFESSVADAGETEHEKFSLLDRSSSVSTHGITEIKAFDESNLDNIDDQPSNDVLFGISEDTAILSGQNVSFEGENTNTVLEQPVIHVVSKMDASSNPREGPSSHPFTQDHSADHTESVEYPANEAQLENCASLSKRNDNIVEESDIIQSTAEATNFLNSEANQSVNQYTDQDGIAGISEPHVQTDFEHLFEFALTAPTWMLDSDVSSCMNCQCKFTVVKRRHHCRACGKIYCSSCCNLKFSLPYMDNKLARVCQTCANILLRKQAMLLDENNFIPDNQVPGLYLDSNAGDEPAASAAETSDIEHSIIPRTEEPPDYNATEMFPTNAITGAQSPVQNADAPTESEMLPTRLRSPMSSGASRADVSPFSSSVSLPPLLRKTDQGFVVEDSPNHEELLYLLKKRKETVAFLLNKHLVVRIKIVKLNSSVKRKCWCFSTEGMQAADQEDMVILLECLPKESSIPQDLLTHFNTAFRYAKQGHRVTDLGYTIFGQPFLGSLRNAGFVYVKSSFQCLDNLILPSGPHIFGILIQRDEVSWVQLFPIRLILRLGAEYKEYPCPLWSVRNRDPLFGDVGHTIMNLLADFKNFQYTLPRVTGTHVHLESQKVVIQLPQNRYDEVLKVVNAADEYVMAFEATFSNVADSYLVCIQDGPNYKTQSINLEDRQQNVTGASFVVFNGALKSNNDIRAKVSIVEDGVMIQMVKQLIEDMRRAILQTSDFTIYTRSVNSDNPGIKVVELQWVSKRAHERQSIISPVDGIVLGSTSDIKINTHFDFSTPNIFRLRWTELFFGERTSCNITVEFKEVTADIAKACSSALQPYLADLYRMGKHRIGLRVNLGPDTVGYMIGSQGSPLDKEMSTDLDNELIPAIHNAVNPSSNSPSSMEFLFSVVEMLS